MARVYVPQIKRKYDFGISKPVYDFSAAAVHGALTEVLPPEFPTDLIGRAIPLLKESLSNFKEEDCLLAVGSPDLIAACAGILFQRMKTVKMLKWDRQIGNYLVIEITI